MPMSSRVELVAASIMDCKNPQKDIIAETFLKTLDPKS